MIPKGNQTASVQSILYHLQVFRADTQRCLFAFTAGLPESNIVEQGDIIGLVGSTGYSTGAHLHFEVRIGEYAINPWRLFDGSSTIYQWEDVEMPQTEETESAESIESTEDAAGIEITENTEGIANED